MAVYKKTYKGYDGPLTPSWSRFLVIPRYAFEDLHRSRFLTTFFIASFLYPLICALIIYVQHNLSVLKVINLEKASQLISINSTFFLSVLGWQGMLAFFLAAFIGPGQISPDLTNNGLSLYLARPFSRAEYVLGKASVLFILMSMMTWVPGLMLFGLQGYLEGNGWASDNARIASGLLFGSLAWIVLLVMLALAISAWVKWKPGAGALMFGIFFVAAGFGVAINGVQRTKWGHLLNISHLMGSVWVQLFEGKVEGGRGAVFFHVMAGEEIPVWCCWAVLAGLCAICWYMLQRKIRGAEVVR